MTERDSPLVVEDSVDSSDDETYLGDPLGKFPIADDTGKLWFVDKEVADATIVCRGQSYGVLRTVLVLQTGYFSARLMPNSTQPFEMVDFPFSNRALENALFWCHRLDLGSTGNRLLTTPELTGETLAALEFLGVRKFMMRELVDREILPLIHSVDATLELLVTFLTQLSREFAPFQSARRAIIRRLGRLLPSLLDRVPLLRRLRPDDVRELCVHLRRHEPCARLLQAYDDPALGPWAAHYLAALQGGQAAAECQLELCAALVQHDEDRAQPLWARAQADPAAGVLLEAAPRELHRALLVRSIAETAAVPDRGAFERRVARLLDWIRAYGRRYGAAAEASLMQQLAVLRVACPQWADALPPTALCGAAAHLPTLLAGAERAEVRLLQAVKATEATMDRLRERTWAVMRRFGVGGD